MEFELGSGVINGESDQRACGFEKETEGHWWKRGLLVSAFDLIE